MRRLAPWLPVLAPAVVILAVAACGWFESPPVPGALSRTQAIEAAQREMGPGSRTLVAATFARAVDAGVTGVDARTFVWRVSFAVDERRPCGPAPGGRICHITSRSVVIDAMTGTFLMGEETGEQTGD